jgi:sugar/nucleoside kinase (ribokinase family)
VDALVLNDSEAELLTGRQNLVTAGREILELGPARVVVKKGAHGTMLFTRDQVVPLPAYPTAEVYDPTGAGDSFAGGLMGHLARCGSRDDAAFKKAIAYGTVAASFTVESFGTQKLAAVSEAEVGERLEEYAGFLRIE